MNIDYLQDHIASPRFSGLLHAPSVDHTCANRSCGDSIRLTLHIDGETVSGVGWNAKAPQQAEAHTQPRRGVHRE